MENMKKLREVFDEPLDYDLTEQLDEKEYQFNTENHSIKVFLTKSHDEELPNDINQDNLWSCKFRVDGSIEYNEENVFSMNIFSTIIQIIRDFVEEEKPTAIKAGATSEKRANIYEKLFKNFNDYFEEVVRRDKEIIAYNYDDDLARFDESKKTLKEVIDEPAEYVMTTIDDNLYYANFEAGENDIDVTFKSGIIPEYSIDSFDKPFQIDFEVNGEYEHGSESNLKTTSVIFSTIVNIVGHFIDLAEPDAISAEVISDKRLEIVKKLLKRYANSFDEIKTHGYHIICYKNKKEAEND